MLNDLYGKINLIAGTLRAVLRIWGARGTNPNLKRNLIFASISQF